MPLEPTCEIQVSRRVQATIGGHHVKMVPGEMYTVVLNVRDTLRESGYLLETP
jgi:hypothetical protein